MPPEWTGFRGFLQSDFQSTLFWFKHVQFALNFTLAATFVLLADGIPWQQVARVAVNSVAVLTYMYLLVRHITGAATARLLTGVPLTVYRRGCCAL